VIRLAWKGLVVRPIIELLAAALAAAGLALASAAQAQDAARKDLVLTGDAQCTRCHDQSDDTPVLAIGKTRHGVRADGRTPTCTSCHGASETHVNKPADAKERPQPDRMFGRLSPTPVETLNQSCLACHQGGKRIHWQIGPHAARDVACTSCHQVHTGHDKARDRALQVETCTACHKEQRAQVSRPSRHPMPEGKVVCTDCHNPHGTAGPKMLVRDSVNDTCVTCHMEKRGPFVRTHQPVQEDCSICHNPHGTTTPYLLKARSPFLCQQCHEPTSHRGNIGSLTGTSTSANAIARGCLNCHTQIHGTNNPANIGNQRTLRR
jgi:DmsE family decaheme c-type cytochrome